MRVTVLELPASWGEPDRMLDDVEARLAARPPGDLVLLPEQSLHGYVCLDADGELDFDVTPLAEPIDGPTARRCAAIAAAHRTHLVAPLPLREGDAIYNAMIAWAPTGAPAFVYRKRHPWLPEGWATPGPSPPPIAAIAGHAITIGVCYDLHFLPRDARDQLDAADLLLFPSAWVEEPDERPDRLCRLAGRFDLHILNANWGPGVVRIPGQGGSCLVGPQGDVLAWADPGGRIDFTLPDK